MKRTAKTGLIAPATPGRIRWLISQAFPKTPGIFLTYILIPEDHTQNYLQAIQHDSFTEHRLMKTTGDRTNAHVDTTSYTEQTSTGGNAKFYYKLSPLACQRKMPFSMNGRYSSMNRTIY